MPGLGTRPRSEAGTSATAWGRCGGLVWSGSNFTEGVGAAPQKMTLGDIVFTPPSPTPSSRCTPARPGLSLWVEFWLDPGRALLGAVLCR